MLTNRAAWAPGSVKLQRRNDEDATRMLSLDSYSKIASQAHEVKFAGSRLH